MGCYILLKIKISTILTLIRFSQEKHESGIFELVDTGNQQSNKEVAWQKVFYVFWKYKNTKIKCI